MTINNVKTKKENIFSRAGQNICKTIKKWDHSCKGHLSRGAVASSLVLATVAAAEHLPLGFSVPIIIGSAAAIFCMSLRTTLGIKDSLCIGTLCGSAALISLGVRDSAIIVRDRHTKDKIFQEFLSRQKVQELRVGDRLPSPHSVNQKNRFTITKIERRTLETKKGKEKETVVRARACYAYYNSFLGKHWKVGNFSRTKTTFEPTPQ